MSTSLLYHGWSLKDYKHLKTQFQGGAVVFHVERRESRRYCAVCKSRDVAKAGRRPREFKGTPIGTRRVRIVAHLHRQACRSCGAVCLEPLTLADPKKTYTRQLARYVLEQCKRASIADVARMTDLPWKVVCEILKKDLEARKKKIDLRHRNRSRHGYHGRGWGAGVTGRREGELECAKYAEIASKRN